MNISIKNELSNMSIEEKIMLVEDLWDNISESHATTIPLTDEQKEIIDKRFENYNKNPETAIHWNDLKSKLVKKHNL